MSREQSAERPTLLNVGPSSALNVGRHCKETVPETENQQ